MKPLLTEEQAIRMWLNPEPTEAQRAQFIKHKARGTTPGNPKWYRSAAIVPYKAFVPGRPPVYPHIESGQQWMVWYGPHSIANNSKSAYRPTQYVA